MSDTGNRVHVRTKLRARIKLMDEEHEALEAFTADISDGGLFVLLNDASFLTIGMRIKVQVQDIPGEAPILEAEVVRSSAEGFGLKFI